MATTVHGDVTGSFVVVNSAALDIASGGAVSATNSTVTVTMPDGTTNPLLPTDLIMAIPPATLEAGVSVQSAVYASPSTLTLRTTNATAGTIDPASQAAGAWQFVVHRR